MITERELNQRINALQISSSDQREWIKILLPIILGSSEDGGYATIEDLADALTTYVETGDLTSTLADYVESEALTETLTDYLPLSDRIYDARAFRPQGLVDGGVTNNDTSIAAVLALITAATPTATNRCTLVIPAGNYAFQTPFVVPPYTDFVQLAGSKLTYTGTTRTTAAVTVGGPNTIMAERGAKYLGINIYTATTHLWWPVASGGTVDLDKFAAFRIKNSDRFDFSMVEISGFAIGPQLFPEDGATSGNLASVTYGHLRLNTFSGVKICVDCRGNLNNGFVNQNSFYEGDLSCSSLMEYAGSAYGIRYSCESGGYTGQNNNILNNPCFQLQFANVATSGWVSGGTAVAGRRYHYLGNSYLVSVGGVMSATPPTHTSGAVANGAATLVFEDLLRRTPELYEGAGGWNQITGARREGGIGPSRIIRNPVSNTGQNSTAEYLFFATITAAVAPAQGHASEIEFQGVTVAQAKGTTGTVELVSFNAHDKVTTEIRNIHRRAIKGTTVWNIPGVTFAGTATVGAAITQDTSTAAIRLMVDGLTMDAATSVPMILVPFSSEFGKVAVTPLAGQDRSNPPRFRAYALDSSKNLLTNRTGDTQQLIVSDAFGSASLHWVAGQNDDYKTRFIMPATSACAYVALQFDGGAISGFHIVLHQTLFDSATYFQSSPPTVWPHTQLAPRRSAGLPTVGFFETAGEFITNTAYTGVGTSPGWYVSTVGVLAPDWATATAVKLGEFRKNDSKVYYASADGTTGATAPTHGSGSASDDTVTWVYYSAQAALTAAPNS
jgi:hypothetical protein